MAKELGWIKLHRTSFNNEMYFSEPFTRWQAWCDLLLLANHQEGWVRVRGIRYIINRGETGYSMPELAKRWKWSKGKVIRFLNELQNDNQVVLQKNNVTTLISIVNYSKYQGDDTANSIADSTANETANGPQTGSQTDTNKNVKNDNNEKEYNKINNSEGVFSTPSGFPNDVILPTEKYTAADFNGLPEQNNKSIRNFLLVVKKATIEAEEISSLWEVFKTQELTGVKLYRNKEDVYRHFLNWTKKQTFRKTAGARVVKPKAGNPERVVGVRFLNDFRQCEMSDGTVINLDDNQFNEAKYLGTLKPKHITKN